MSDDKKPQTTSEPREEETSDQTREAPVPEIPDLVVPEDETKNVSEETRESVNRALAKDDYAETGKAIQSGVNKGKEIAENMDLQEKLNALVILIKTEYGPKLNSIDNKWKKVPRAVQSYIVHAGPLAAMPATLVFPPGAMPAAAACAATSFLVKTGLLSFKGEIKDGKINLNKSVTIGDGMKKLTKLIIKGLQYYFEELQGMDAVLDPIIEGAQYGDKLCAVAKENLHRHLNETGEEQLEIEPSIYGKKAA